MEIWRHCVSSFTAGAPAEPYEGLEAEECGILDGCAHGRCVRVPEGFTCDCFDGYRLDTTRMACVGEGQEGQGLSRKGRSCGERQMVREPWARAQAVPGTGLWSF